MTKPLVAYFRVSTREQGRSGLGIDTQRAAVARFAEAEGFEVVAEFSSPKSRRGSRLAVRPPHVIGFNAHNVQISKPILLDAFRRSRGRSFRRQPGAA